MNRTSVEPCRPEGPVENSGERRLDGRRCAIDGRLERLPAQ